MKLNILKSAVLISLVAMCAVSSGCNVTVNESSQQETTQAATTQAPTTAPVKNTVKAVTDLMPTDVGTNDFAGTWKITNSDSDEIKNLQYTFDGDQRATLIMDNMGYLGTYAIKSNVFSCQLMYGINGTYAYEKDGENKIVLVDTMTQEKVILEKCELSIIPEAPKKPEIDEKLVGTWYDETGEYFYFDKSGVMYSNQYGIMCTFFTYTAKEGKITAEYVMDKNETDTYTYTLNDDGTLTMNDSSYKKVSDSELLDYIRGGYKGTSPSMS